DVGVENGDGVGWHAVGGLPLDEAHGLEVNLPEVYALRRPAAQDEIRGHPGAFHVRLSNGRRPHASDVERVQGQLTQARRKVVRARGGHLSASRTEYQRILQVYCGNVRNARSFEVVFWARGELVPDLGHDTARAAKAVPDASCLMQPLATRRRNRRPAKALWVPGQLSNGAADGRSGSLRADRWPADRPR